MIYRAERKADRQDAGKRLDLFIVGLASGIGRALAVELISAGRVKVNGRQAPKSYKVAEGDIIEACDIPEKSDLRVVPNLDIPLEIIFEDKWLIAVNKPGGVPVHPVRYSETGTLANGLIARYPGLAGIGGDPMFPAFVHRIDNDTTGLVLAAKTEYCYRVLREQFSHHKAVKTYLAVVQGCLAKEGKFANYLAHDPASRGRMRVVNGAAAGGERKFRAVSEVRVISSGRSVSLAEIVIRTGVTHQIRCLMAYLGHPVLGDKVYGANGKTPEGIHGQCLHAWKVEINHPGTGKPKVIEAPLPSYFGEMSVYPPVSGTDSGALRRGTPQGFRRRSSAR